MPTFEHCEREIRDLHAFFADWYCGEEMPFERVEAALAPGFERVAPDGSVHDRETVLEGIESRRDAHEWFRIEVRNVEPVFLREGRALIQYEEWQFSPEEESGRISTALFEPPVEHEQDRTAPREPNPVVRWTYLQETWLEPPESATDS
jgi:hypothetical protein